MKILTMPRDAKALRQRCAHVDFARWTQATLGRTIMLMLDAMYLKDGIGLAGPQVGLDARIIVVDPIGERHQARVLINPEIYWWSGELEAGPEGCLSVPGTYGMVERHARVKVRYQDRDGLNCDLDTDDDALLARVIQHECDHLDGVLFVDKLLDP
jgi:peptide deformylase